MNKSHRRERKVRREKFYLKISAIIFSFTLILTGCSNNRQAETKGIKIGELTPTTPGKNNTRKDNLQIQIIHNTNINVATYELPADKISELEAVWKNLSDGPLRFNNAESFIANDLRAGAGTMREFSKVVTALNNAKAKKLFTTSLLIQTNQPEMVDIARLTRRTGISYIGRQGDIETAEAGPAILGMQVTARQLLPDATTNSFNTATASIQITPIIYSSAESVSVELADKIRANDLRIYSAGFGLKVKPGDFIVLAPAKMTEDETTAAGRFFIKQEPPATIRILLFICVSIT